MTKILNIGEAVYRRGNSIKISEPDDWGWYYNSGDGDVLVIQVRKSIFGKYKPIIPSYINQTPVNQNIQINVTDITDLEVHDNKNSRLPETVEATIKISNKRNRVSFQRISLKSYSELPANGDIKEALLEPYSGYYHSLFIFMLGATSSGKSCWIHALKTRAVQERVRSQRHIHYFGQEEDVVEKLEPTNINKRIVFNRVFLCKRKSKKIQTVVFIVDLAGEVNDLNREDKEYTMLRTSIREYASGIFVVKNGETMLTQGVAKHAPGEFILLDLLQDENDLGEDKFCYILTCADKIKAALEKDTAKQDKFNLVPDSPIFSPTDCSTEQMYQNMAIASYIMKDRIIEDSPCFVVSCCSNTGTINEQTGKELLDFGKGYNSDLPLVYMLKKIVKIK